MPCVEHWGSRSIALPTVQEARLASRLVWTST